MRRLKALVRRLGRPWHVQIVPGDAGEIRHVRLRGWMLALALGGVALFWLGFTLAVLAFVWSRQALLAAEARLEAVRGESWQAVRQAAEESNRLRDENRTLRNRYEELFERLRRLEETVEANDERLKSIAPPTSTAPAKGRAVFLAAKRETARIAALTARPLAAGAPPASALVEAAERGLSALEKAAAAQGAAIEETAAEVEAYRERLRRTPDIAPAAGRVTSGFGFRLDPFTRTQRFHEGVDFAHAVGTPVVATAKGTVVFAGRDGGYGLMVEIDHGGGLSTVYAHLSAIAVRVGETVDKGAVIGRMGNTGRSTGPHLHYEVRRYGRPVDPAPYLGGEIRVEAGEAQD
ncbi:MAG: peptidoglycan DD-metalloendopeptidase family protein [Hydrogenibacillus schlegelii]|nr:peptidoglycan DD-metalloendopeptidase family protein [Hydrogenibacillus schlegelii]